MEILNTKLFNREDMEEGSVMISATKVDNEKKEDLPSCCVKSLDDGKVKCCKSKNKNLIDSGLSTILLGVVAGNKDKPPKASQITRHEKRFGITSFVYRSRRPFHPGRLYDNILEKYFILRYEETDGPELRSHIEKLQKEAVGKQKERVQLMGELLRSKGFIWIATSNYIMGGFQQAGNILRIEAQGPWMSENPEQWEGTPNEALIYKDMVDSTGKEYPYMDRRQEMVFIGHKLKHLAIQEALDSRLLTEDEMKLGPRKWEETMGPLDKIKMSVDYDVDGGEEEEGDEEDGDEVDEGEIDEEENNNQVLNGPPSKKIKSDEKNKGE